MKMLCVAAHYSSHNGRDQGTSVGGDIEIPVPISSSNISSSTEINSLNNGWEYACGVLVPPSESDCYNTTGCDPTAISKLIMPKSANEQGKAYKADKIALVRRGNCDFATKVTG
jgi:hypothetical protein